MGLFDRVWDAVTRGAGGDLDHCPYCGEELTGWECSSCDVEFVMEGGQLVERDPSEDTGSDDRCMGCDLRMKGEYVAAWEDGDNVEPYVRCSRCGCENPARSARPGHSPGESASLTRRATSAETRTHDAVGDPTPTSDAPAGGDGDDAGLVRSCGSTLTTRSPLSTT